MSPLETILAQTDSVCKGCSKTDHFGLVLFIVEETSNQRIGRNVRRLRELKGMSQAELAEGISRQGIPGFHPQTITKIEAGNRSLKFDEAVAMCQVLEVTAEELNKVGDAYVRRNALATAIEDLAGASIDAVEALAAFLAQADYLQDLVTKAHAQGDIKRDFLRVIEGHMSMTTSVDDIVRTAYATNAGEIVRDEHGERYIPILHHLWAKGEEDDAQEQGLSDG